MIKVLLINPPLTYYKGSLTFDLHFPISLMYVAAAVKEICYVEIFDCLASEIATRENNAIRWGASAEEIRKVIEEKKPDVVGITVPSTSQYRNAELVAIIAKEVNPKIITVFGGPDPSIRFKTILENAYCDYCVIGEGEQTFYEFISRLSSSSSCEDLEGLAYKHEGVIHYKPRPFNTNLDAIPFPAFDLVDVNKYLKSKNLYAHRSAICRNSITLITSRGCPYNCVFCSTKLHMGQKFRAHSPDYIMKLIRFCITKYGITRFHFEDDNLTFDKLRFETILDDIIKENLQIEWDTPNGVRVDSLNYNILEKVKRSGCSELTLAIESGNQRVLDDVIHKKLDLKYVIDVVRYCKELNISLQAFYVIGFPGEKVNEIIDTINFAIRLYKDYNVFPEVMVATPLYGTELYEICLKDKILKREPTFDELSVGIQNWGDPLISTSDFSKDDVKKGSQKVPQNVIDATQVITLKEYAEIN